MKISFYAIVWITAIVLAISSAFYSVFGLSQLFSGAVVAIIIVASILESSKIVLATYIHDYWNQMSKMLKAYMTFALLCLMIITSLGVYGFLTSAYQDTIKNFKLKQSDISKIDIKIESFKKQLDYLKQNEIRIEKQLGDIQQIKSNQDKTISTVYSSSKKNNTKLLEKSIANTNILFEKNTQELSTVQSKTSQLIDSVNFYETQKLQLQTDNQISEVGPLMYISKALSIEMDNVVNYLVLLIMIVFDPLAVALVFAANNMKKKNNFDYKEKNIILSELKNNDIGDVVDTPDGTLEPTEEITEQKMEFNGEEFESNEYPTTEMINETEETDLYGEPDNRIKYSKSVRIR